MKYDSKLDKNMLSNDVEYFYSLHGPRFDYMNEQMAKSLSKKYGKEFRPIRIINAWPSKKYDTANYIVMNKRGYELRDELGSPAVYLPDYEDVNVEFSRDIEIRKLSKKLLKKQKKIYVFPFTTSFLELPQDMYQILGPDSLIAKEFDSKINQLKLFDKLDLPGIKQSFTKMLITY